MVNYEENIGINIRTVRLEKGLSQEALASECGFSNTTLSAYENGRKTPNLKTIAKIAKQLNVSIERLYYGDENIAFITAAPDEGKKIVNSIYYLWKEDIISYYDNYISSTNFQDYCQDREPKGAYLQLYKFRNPIKRLILALNEFQHNKDTYPDQEKYLELILASVATEINNNIEQERRFLEKKRMEKLKWHFLYPSKLININKTASQMVEEEYNSFASYCELAGIKGSVD